ncbi:MAG: hypothetical protein WCF84_22505 [Anaerolineae bacterium]
MDYERARLWPHSPLSAALAAQLPFNEIGATTLVLYPNHSKHHPLGFVQARMRRHRPEGDISYIAPSLDAHPDGVTIWYRLLAEATNALCEKGCQRIYVQMPNDLDAEQVFRQAGFGVYAHEDIYLLTPEHLQTFSRPTGPRVLRRQRTRDGWNLLRLYNAATPRPVQQAEGMLSTEGRLGKLADWWEQASGTGYVLDANSDGGLVGAARVTRGSAAIWLRLYLHPGAQNQAGELVCGALSLVNTGHPRPIYCSVRDYEGGIRVWLETAQFEYQFKRSLLVKHATVRVKEPALWAVPVLEKPAPVVPTHIQAREWEKEHFPALKL